MPINKKAHTRYLTYDRCLRNRGRSYSWKELQDEVNNALAEEGYEGIGKTQFYEDINFMERSEWQAPIERYKDGRTVFYRYSDKNYSINNMPLNETELKQIKSAVEVMSRIKGLPQFEWINEIIPAMESKFGLIQTDKQVISFEWNEDYEGLKFITPIFNAIVNHRVIEVCYKDFKSETPYTIVFHPYYLKQFNNRWFVLGCNPSSNLDISNLALDRVVMIEEKRDKYLDNETEWEEYFSDFIGVTKLSGDIVEIQLLFSKDKAPYILTKPIHQTQKKIRNDKDGLKISIKVIPNYELESLILSHGETVKVLSPENFRNRIVERISNSLSQYDK